ncbi:RnfABCDGE type electron transport complex subunit D [Bosea sp. (in: a-proteobacteria)]|uniref:RnfABCDGE type electron transport complex subunit D n=1 Tax=Bosea sp. (in: a-proteobacteria) TaxID=1871050 RepID=UPI00261D01EC|nr:RnfABCDGE type electron transport complex subunit D [Bosea sp. (in: a-proteobacteria)]MCO5093579.1 RnfABCDGE type electron transport complex subunit D [Bosea sp. (in: a-proteobacteria)]
MSGLANRLYGLIGRREVARSNVPALLGLMAPLVVLFGLEAGLVAGRVALLVLLVLGWQLAFRKLRGQPFGPEGLVTALLIALLTPPSAPYWQLLFAGSFGVVLAELAFGGRGRNFVHPAVAALAFLMFSFTGEGYRAGPQIPVWTLVPALVLLLASGQASWRVLLAAGGSMAAVAWGLSGAAAQAVPLDGAVAAALLFLAADPVASAATNPGRFVHGLLAGSLAALFALSGEAFGATVFAILVASVFAPLIDHCVIALHGLRRRRRHV